MVQYAWTIGSSTYRLTLQGIPRSNTEVSNHSLACVYQTMEIFDILNLKYESTTPLSYTSLESVRYYTSSSS